MGFEVQGDTLTLEPGLIDVHGHPRIFDAIVPDGFLPVNEGQDGKAGLGIYTQAALRSGFTAMNAMTNEQLRRFTGTDPEHTELIPYPVLGHDRILATQSAIGQESLMPMGFNLTLDPSIVYIDKEHTIVNEEALFMAFKEADDDALGLKIFGDISTGGFNVNPRDIPYIAEVWYLQHPERPITLHLENENVGIVLNQIRQTPNGMDIPINIAHVSSREELEAVIEAKKAGMNVMCEVTPHHLFLDEDEGNSLGGYGCMKPTLKKQSDIDYLWANIDSIDWIGSDCAPHRTSDKITKPYTYGVVTHTSFLPLLIGAVKQNKLTWEQLYDKTCVAPRKRFGLPLDDNSLTKVALFDMVDTGGSYHDNLIRPEYAPNNPFARGSSNKPYPFVGVVTEVKAGMSVVRFDVETGTYHEEVQPSRSHLLRPSTLVRSVRYWKNNQNLRSPK